MGHKSGGPKRWSNRPTHIQKCFWRTKRSEQTLQYAFSIVNVLLQTHPSVLFMSWDFEIHLLSPFSFLPGHPISLVIYSTHCNVSEQCWKMPKVTVFLLPLVYSRECYCVSVFPHMVAKKCLLKKPQRWSGAAWLLLPRSGALLREAASFLYHLRLPDPVMC